MYITEKFVDKKYNIFVAFGPKVKYRKFGPAGLFEKYDPDTFKKMFYDEVLTKTLLKCKDETYALKVKEHTIESIARPNSRITWGIEMELVECKNPIIRLRFIRLVQKFKRKYTGFR